MWSLQGGNGARLCSNTFVLVQFQACKNRGDKLTCSESIHRACQEAMLIDMCAHWSSSPSSPD